MSEIINSLFFIATAFARGGGGGSSSGSGGGGSGIIGFIVFIIVLICGLYIRNKKIKKAKETILQAESKDPTWDENSIQQRVSNVFLSFQKDWSDFNVEGMKQYLTDAYYRRMVLEMAVLKNMKRKNLVENPNIKNIAILEAKDSDDNNQDTFTVEITARANDQLIDEEAGKVLYKDDNAFTEYWIFKRCDNDWKLDLIKQGTENTSLTESKIVDFSNRNNFFYDPDFGWLMMPNQGAIFRKSTPKTSDINNHVIGYFRDKIVEFYTFIPISGQSSGYIYPNNHWVGTSIMTAVVSSSMLGNSGGADLDKSNYIVAQAILPINHFDILLRKKRWLFNFAPKGLRRIETESNDFNKKFCLWSDPNDQATSFELLTPNFMEKIYALPYELNIEVVGNVLYLYAKSRQDINYDSMLEILSWAFDEMKM